MSTYCKNCQVICKDVAQFMFSGCNNCGGKKIVHKKSVQEIAKSIKMDDNIAIVMKNKGEYIINLEAIANSKKNDPIMVLDNKGRVNVIFNPDV